MTANRFNFRVWNKKNKIFNYDFNLFHVAEDGMMLFYRKSNFDYVERNEDDNYVLMQSTGMVDKNGREIFENDILTDGSIKYLVRFEEEKARFIMKPILGEKILLTDYEELGKRYMHYYEIIGNIYENKELLKS